MSTKTISVRDEAYRRLVAARRTPHESFSEVIMRARWESEPVTAGALLALVRERGPIYADAELDAVTELKKADRPPRDKWARD